MKRKQLQALCKEHGIPANLTNLEMADKLSSLLKVMSNLNFFIYYLSFKKFSVFLVKFVVNV